MESAGVLGTVLGCSAGLAVCGVVFAAYKLGLLYQLFHKVGLSQLGMLIVTPTCFCPFPQQHYN